MDPLEIFARPRELVDPVLRKRQLAGAYQQPTQQILKTLRPVDPDEPVPGRIFRQWGYCSDPFVASAAGSANTSMPSSRSASASSWLVEPRMARSGASL